MAEFNQGTAQSLRPPGLYHALSKHRHVKRLLLTT